MNEARLLSPPSPPDSARKENGENAMRFGIFYEHQLPKPWNAGDEAKLFHEAL